MPLPFLLSLQQAANPNSFEQRLALFIQGLICFMAVRHAFTVQVDAA